MRAHGIPLNGLDSGLTRILVVDADESLRSGLREALNEDGGYEVMTAASALEAGAAAQEVKPGVVIVDVTLPDITPESVARFVRTLAGPESTCLIGVARGMTDARGHALLQAGFDGYLNKPFDVHSLIRLIEERAATATTQTGI
jgi:DNA-binding response OmpR family regulator